MAEPYGQYATGALAAELRDRRERALTGAMGDIQNWADVSPGERAELMRTQYEAAMAPLKAAAEREKEERTAGTAYARDLYAEAPAAVGAAGMGYFGRGLAQRAEIDRMAAMGAKPGKPAIPEVGAEGVRLTPPEEAAVAQRNLALAYRPPRRLPATAYKEPTIADIEALTDRGYNIQTEALKRQYQKGIPPELLRGLRDRIRADILRGTPEVHLSPDAQGEARVAELFAGRRSTGGDPAAEAALREVLNDPNATVDQRNEAMSLLGAGATTERQPGLLGLKVWPFGSTVPVQRWGPAFPPSARPAAPAAGTTPAAPARGAARTYTLAEVEARPAFKALSDPEKAAKLAQLRAAGLLSE